MATNSRRQSTSTRRKSVNRVVTIKKRTNSDEVILPADQGEKDQEQELNPFIIDAAIDAEDSEFQLTYTHIALEDILDDVQQRRQQNQGLKVTRDVPLSEDVVCQLQLLLKRARDRLKGDACVRLLSCIRKVIDAVHVYRVQGRLQDMVLSETKVLEEDTVETRDLPKPMESPRSEVHVQRRMQHFDNLHKEHETVHHIHPTQIAQAVQVKTLRAHGKFASNAKMPYPDTRRSNSLASRFAESEGALSAMAGNMKTLARSSHDMEVMSFTDFGKNDIENGEETEWMKNQSLPRALSATSRRSLSATSVRRERSDRPVTPVYYQTPFEAPPPKLTGQTGGFHEKSPVPPRRCSTAPGRMRASTTSTELEETLLEMDTKLGAGVDRPHLTRGLSIRDLPRLSSPSNSRKRKSMKRSEGSRRSKSSAGSDRSSLEHSHRSIETEAIGTTLKVPCSGSRLHTSPSMKTTMEKSSLPRSVNLPNKLDSRVARMTQHFLQLRGFEKPAIGWAGSGMGATHAEDLLANARSELHRHHCVPPTNKPYDAKPDNPRLVERCWTPEVGYARGCLNEGVNPNIVKFFATPSFKLDFANYLIGDSDLQAFVDALQSPEHMKSKKSHRPLVTDIILTNNKRLSDAMISRFLSVVLHENRLSGTPCIGQVKVLTFSNCTGFGLRSFESMCNFLQMGVELRHLEELDLRGVSVPATVWPRLCDCLISPRFLRKLCLAQTGCGMRSQEDCYSVADLIGGGSCKHLRSLDISGNHFLHEGCAALGDALRNACDEFQEVDLSHNAGLSALRYGTADFNPIMHVLEALGETTVTKAAFVNCQISFAEDCILEDAVESSDITHLELSDNPHGEQGLRCLVRLLLARRLESLGVSALRNSPLPPDALKYDYVDPSAAYELNLGQPQHRSVLRLLLKRSEQCGGNFSCFLDEKLDEKRLADGMRSLCTKRIDRGGDDWQVPREGILAFTFKLPLCYTPQDELEKVLYKFERSQRIPTDFDGFARLLRLYRSLPDDRSQRLLMCAMSRDLVLKLCHLKHLLKMGKDELNFIVVTLLPTLNVQTSRTVLFDLIDSCREKATKMMVQQIKHETASLLYFNAMHPDGHYNLELTSFTERRTAQQCLVISQWVRTQSMEFQRPDLSEHGNHECLRHVYHSGHSVVYDSASWQLPDEGQFEFDFVLPRMPLKADAITDVYTVDELSNKILSSPCRFQDRLKAIRLVCHRLVLRPEEFLEFLRLFPSCSADFDYGKKSGFEMHQFRPLVEAYVLLYNRTLYHSKVVSPRILFNSSLFQPEESLEIRRRLGWIHTFDIANLHTKVSNLGTRHGPLDLSTWDGWVVTKAIIAISQTEAHPNFENCYWSEKHTLYERGYTFTVPKEWVPDPPRVGRFTCSWHSSPDEINHVRRREFAERYLGWTFAPTNHMKRRSTFRQIRSASSYFV